MLNNNPVLVARYFQYKVEVFFKEIIIDGRWVKQNIMLYVLNFKKGVVHMSIPLYMDSQSTKYPNEAAYIKFSEQTINAQLPDPLNDPELFELVKTYQVHAHSRTCWKYIKNECRFSYGRFVTEKTIIAKPFDSELTSDEKKEVSMGKSTTKESQRIH